MRSGLRDVLIYGAVAALALSCLTLSCLKLIALSPLLVDWERELAAAAIALVGVVVGMVVRERNESRRGAHGQTARGGAPVKATLAASLSPREREILRLLGEGLSNKQMARRLTVSENTVKTHLANVYGKLGVNKRVEAVIAAQSLGLLGDHPKITRPGDSSDATSSAIVTPSTTLPRS